MDNTISNRVYYNHGKVHSTIVMNPFKQMTTFLKSLIDSRWPCVILFSFSVVQYFISTFPSDIAGLYGNDAFLILILSTKKRYSSFLKKCFVVQKTCFKGKVLKTFKFSTDRHIKTSQSISWRAILKIPSTVFYKNLCSLC